jgi:hypothetical protein
MTILGIVSGSFLFKGVLDAILMSKIFGNNIEAWFQSYD